MKTCGGFLVPSDEPLQLSVSDSGLSQPVVNSNSLLISLDGEKSEIAVLLFTFVLFTVGY